MESKIPLPTDNIFKFYALFGVLIMITSIVSIVWLNNSTNELIHSLIREYESLPQKGEDMSPLGAVIEKRLEVEGENKSLFLKGLSSLVGISILLMFYGFREWHTKIQPKQDEYFDLQLQKLRKELETLNKQGRLG